MKKYFYITVLAASLAFAAGCTNKSGGSFDSGGAADWHLFRGGPTLDGHTDVRLPRRPELLWSYLTDSPATSSPVVDDGTTYWSDRRGHIRGVDANGRQVFDLDLDTGVEATPMIHDGVLYIGRVDGLMDAVSLDRLDQPGEPGELDAGTRLWQFETMGQISASPNITRFEGRKALVFGSYDSNLYCVDRLTGEEINRFTSGYYLNGAVAVSDNTAVFGGCDGWIRLIDTRTGIQTDSLMTDSYIPASGALEGDFCYIGDHSGNIYELNLDEGRIASHRKIMEASDDSGTFVSTPAVTPRTLYIIYGDKHLYSIDRKTGDVNWKYLLKGTTGESSPVVCRDGVVACTKTGIVSVHDVESGELLWEYDTGEQIVASPAVIEGRFFILTAKGTLLCFGEKRK